jgi:hypothetical protein
MATVQQLKDVLQGCLGRRALGGDAIVKAVEPW